MTGKSAFIVAVGLVSALSMGTGAYLAVRANRAAGPAAAVAEVPRTAEPVRAAEPAQATPAAPVVGPRTPAPRVSPAESPRLAGLTSRSVPAPEEPTVRWDERPTAPSAALAVPPSTAPPPPAEPPPVTSLPATAPPPDPPGPEAPPRFEEITIKEDAVIGIRIDQSVSSETARLEDRVTARITRDVTVDGRTALPAGTKLEGVVALVESGGQFRGRARLGIRFTTLILAGGLRVPIHTDLILREGESPAADASRKIGAGAVAGAILGAVIGGRKGAAIGSTVGAAGGTAAVMTGERHEAVIAGGAPLTVRLTRPLVITVERDPPAR